MIRHVILSLFGCLILALGTAPAVSSEAVVLGLSQNQISINTSFDGSEILIFGAIKREERIPEGPPLEVIITLAGPSLPVTVRRKEKRLGIWVNIDSVEVDHAPSYYAVLTSGPLREVLSEVEDLRHKISIPRAIRSVGAPQDIADAMAFTEALIRIRTNNDLYHLGEDAVIVEEQTLFRTSVQLPAALTEGAYPMRIFLTREGSVVSTYETTVDVQKVGMERWLFELSRNQPLIYGLMSLAIAIAAGWGASAAFRMFRA